MKFKTYLSSLMILLAMFITLQGCKEKEPDIPVNPLTFELGISNVTDHGADVTVTPSENERTYYADIFRASMFEGKTDEEIIETVAGLINDSNLKTGEITMSGEEMELEAETEYLLLAFGHENGAAGKHLDKKAFTTQKVKETPAPVIKLETTSVEVPAEGKECQISYQIENPVEGIILQAKCEAKFVTDVMCSKTDVVFTVAANEGAARTATINFSYGEATAELKISQAEKKEVPAPVIKLEESSVEVPAEVQSYQISYQIENPVEGIILQAKCDAKFVTDVMCSKTDVVFTVAANDGAARTAEINLSYGEATAVLSISQKEKEEPDLEKMTFELEVNNIGSHDVDVKVTPSDLEQTYYCNVAPSSTFSRLTEEQIIDVILAGIKEGDLKSGVAEFKAQNLERITDYTFYAIGYANGKVTSDLARTEFKTLAKIDMTFNMEVLDVKHNQAELKVTPTNNEATYFTHAMPAAYFEGLSDERIIEAVIGLVVPSKLKTGEQTFTVTDLTAETDYLFFAFGYEEGWITTELHKMNFVTEKKEESTGKFELSLESEFNYEEKVIEFKARCTSQDAAIAGYTIWPTGDLEQMLATGLTIEDLTYDYGGLTELPMDQLGDLNSRGVKICVTDQTPGAKWTMLFDIRNYDGGRATKRADAEYPADVEPNPEITPDLELNGGTGDLNGGNRDNMCWVRMAAQARNVESGSYLNLTRTEFNDKINSGMTLEDIVAENKDKMIPFEAAWVKEINNLGSTTIVLKDLPAETRFTFIAEATNEFGTTVRSVDLKTTAASTEKTFELIVTDVTSTGATLTVIPPDSEITYYAGYTLANRYEGLGEAMIISNIMSGKTPDDLLQGTQVLTPNDLYSGFKYMFYAFGVKDGKAVTGLRTEYFTTGK